MVEIKHKLKIVRGAYKIEIKGQLELPFEMRQKSRFKAKLASGEEVGVMLPHHRSHCAAGESAARRSRDG